MARAVPGRERRRRPAGGEKGIMGELPEYVDGLPNLCGSERLIEAAIATGRDQPVFDGQSPVDIAGIDGAFAVALHMHQPLIPAGGPDLPTAAIISNLQWMLEHPDLGDNHNATVFQWCYKRMGELIPQLLAEGRQPRIMLEYSGTLLHGLRRAGLDDVVDALRPLTCDPELRPAVEWLGCPWGHAVAPSTPVQDYRLQVRAWQHHFAAIFGLEALGRVRGFSPAEMALPNHPDVAYAFVKTLNDCGFQWLLVQEHTVELPDGRPLERPHLPHRLVCTSSQGDTAEIVAVVKTQGSDSKLVGQLQPYDEAKGLSRVELAGCRVPPLVTQIADVAREVLSGAPLPSDRLAQAKAQRHEATDREVAAHRRDSELHEGAAQRYQRRGDAGRAQTERLQAAAARGRIIDAEAEQHRADEEPSGS
jgi:hypothetical protein